MLLLPPLKYGVFSWILVHSRATARAGGDWGWGTDGPPAAEMPDSATSLDPLIRLPGGLGAGACAAS